MVFSLRAKFQGGPLRLPSQDKNEDDTLLQKDEWREVINAIEETLPLYDHVNELISLRQAQRARRYAIQKLDLRNGIHILDSGIGPGNISRLVLSKIKPKLLVGLDESVRLLETARSNLRDIDTQAVELIRGVFEFLPFRDSVFDVIVTSYALRDSLDLQETVCEYFRVCNSHGQLAIVDIGKPDNPLAQAGSMLYMRLLVPMIAKIATLGKVGGNPWVKLFQTYVPLPTNRHLLSDVRRRFPEAELREFFMGGVIAILCRKS
jgi:demethylmenaquinone methyltransferase/2-methoxy-6-polyprenyl-1,4-benzoquinol methylase